MSYQVIARKWRPSAFEEVVGQDHVVRTLSNAVSSGRIGHAYLFSGPRGVGKTTVARILAKCLNCSEGPTATPCRECAMCRAVANGSSVDVLEIDGASNTGVDNIRELRESVRYAPSHGRYKIYIIDEVHMLSESAFNALLKTLEEPPPHVIFIFATTEPHKIPLTIHSRCQRFDFRRIPLKKIGEHLGRIIREEGVKVEEDALYLIARESEGSLRDAQSLLEQVISFSGSEVGAGDVVDALGLMDRSVIFELTEAVLEKDAARCLNIVEKIHDFGYDLKKVSTELIEHIRDLVVIKVSGDGALAGLPEGEAKRLEALGECVGLERLQMLFGIFTRGYEEVVRSSTPRFSLEMMLVRASRLEDMKPVGELIARLEGLRHRSGGQGGAGAAKDRPKVEGRPQRTLPGSEKKDDVSSRDILSYIREKDGLLYTTLESADLSFDGSVLSITLDAKSANFLFGVKKETLEGLCKDFFKRRIEISINKKDKEKECAGVPAGQRLEGADPVLRKALTTLGGRIVEERRRTNV